ncbi:MAG: MIT C-terminal domain-containing protein [Deltaproteobacteria bacterium]
MSDDDYEVEKLTNPVLEEFIKLNTGREPEPLKYHFDNVYADSSTVVSTPRAVYFLDISKNAADEIQQNYGVLIQSSEAIDDSLLRNTYYRILPINTICNSDGNTGWNHLLKNRIPPINSIVISDNFLFTNEDGIRGYKNIVQLFEAVFPDKLSTDFNVLLIAQEHKNKNADWCNKLAGDIKTAINNLKKPYNIVFEMIFAETIHKRIAISNYFTITPDKGFAIFKSDDLSIVHEETEIQIDRIFHRISQNEGDTEYFNAEYSLEGIKKICETVAQYISNRPNDKNYRIMGDCNADKSVKNRLINDV